MTERAGENASFIGSIPHHYDQGLGPNIFVDYAADIASRAAALQPKDVLEIAAGTGIVTRRLRGALPRETRLTATDLNPPMLEVATAKFVPGEDVAFRQADALALPFGDGLFDLLVCQFGVMFFTDKDQGYREAYRVLRTGGHYLFSVWDSHAHNPFGRIIHEIVGGFFETDRPAFMGLPFSYASIDAIKESLLQARFDGIDIAVIRLMKDIADPVDFARGAIYGNPLIDQIKARGVDPDRIVAAISDKFRRVFGYPGRMPLQAIVFSARKAD